jgi:hypothetical protein
MRMLRRSWLLVLALSVGACAMRPETELLELDRMIGERISDGTSLRLTGRGFPLRGKGVVRFRGETRRPGQRPQPVRAEAPIVVRSAGEIEIHGDTSWISKMGERGTFRGKLELRFEGTEGVVFGTLDGIVLDVEPETRRSLRETERLEGEGRAFLERVGIEASVERVPHGGVGVASVREDSPAARLGVQRGDVLLELDGVRVRGLSDLAPAPGEESHAFVVQPDGEGSPTSVVFPLHVASDALSPFAWGLALMVLFMLVWLQFVAGTARVTAFLSRDAPADGDGTLVWLFGASGSAKSAPDRALRAVLVLVGFIAMSLAFVGVGMIFRVLESGFGVGLFLSASLLLRLVARLSGGHSISFSVRMLPFFVVGLPLVISVVAVTLLVGTGDLRLIHEAQGAVPWEWLVFRNPVAFVLFPVFAATALGRVEAPSHDRGIGQVAARAHLLVVSCLGAAIFLGGWNAPGSATPGAAAVTGLLAYAVKCWTLIAIGLFARRVGPGRSADVWRWALPLAILCLIGTAAYLLFGVPPAVERTSGPVLATSAALLFGYLAVARLLRSRRDATLRLHPFL